MFCTSCGNKIDRDDLFCIYCGEKNKSLQTEQHEENKIEEMSKVNEDNVTSKIQEKFKIPISKAQGIKDKSNLLTLIKDAQKQKAKVLAELGILTYEKIRRGELNDDELNSVCKLIIEFDSIIYENSIKIEELEKATKTITCSCGTAISKDAKFCTECGMKVEMPVGTRLFNTCIHCEAKVEENSKFCPCCGHRM